MITNRVILIGNLGADPEIRVLETGVKMARFSIATNEIIVAGDGRQITHTEWHTIVAWREIATYVQQNLKCGSFIRVEGRLRSRQMTDSVTSAVVKVYEIIAHSVQLLSNDAITKCDEKKDPVEPPQPIVFDVDNLPF